MLYGTLPGQQVQGDCRFDPRSNEATIFVQPYGAATASRSRVDPVGRGLPRAFSLSTRPGLRVVSRPGAAAGCDLLREYVVHLLNARRRIIVSFDGSAATTLVQVDVPANAQCQGKSLVSKRKKGSEDFPFICGAAGGCSRP